MASSMIHGDRRLAPTRKGGMTVLGKIAVPKPINLPSQKSENHGLDPNVEIVPKGTISWGSRPSSSGSNPWGSSVLSPKADGSRPSSSGGTRPSTAGSEKGHDSTPNAWGSNLRPSSASGSLTSSHTSLTSLRPRSAETRPGSSQLSRFAEPSAENLGPRDAAAGSAEKSGITRSVKDAFSLSSGDFPTLGSENDSSRKIEGLPDHGTDGRPQSSSGKLPSVMEHMEPSRGDDISWNAEVKGSRTNAWRKDNPQNDGPRPVMERWHGEPHPYQNPNVPPYQYESWHGTPGVNPPAGVWLRGPPAAPPYGSPIPPGGFPMEPYPYFRPQVAPPVLPNPHRVSSQGPGPHRTHSKNGDLYRPHVGDSYTRPAMPMGPGFYPGPVPYEGYYGPPMGFRNPNELDFPFMGMPAGSPIYSRYPNPNAADPSNSHGRSAEARAPEREEFGPHDSRGNRKAVSRQENSWDQDIEEGKWGDRASSGKQRDLPPPMLREGSWGNAEKNDQTTFREELLSAGEASAQSLDSGARHTISVTGDRAPIMDNVTSPRDHALIQKIEGLNAKARVSDGKHDPPSGFDREYPHNVVRVVNVMSGNPMNESGARVYVGRPKSAEAAAAVTTTVPRGSTLGVQNRGSLGKGRVTSQDMDGQQNKNAGSGSSNGSGATSRAIVEAQVQRNLHEMPKLNSRGGDDVQIPGFDPIDSQRAKMREIAQQRAIQLQKEEEERTREQKAKALAKLEELNRRSAYQSKENSSQKVELPASVKEEVSEKQPGPSLGSNLSVTASSHSSNSVAESDEVGNKTLNPPVPSFSFGTVSQELIGGNFVSVMAQNRPYSAVQDASEDRHVIAHQASHLSQQKRLSYKQKQNTSLEKNPPDNSIVETSVELPKESTLGASQLVPVNDTAFASESNIPVEPQLTGDSSTYMRKRNNRSTKNKHKPEGSSSAVSPPVQKEFIEEDVPGNVKLDTSETFLNHPPIQSSSLPREDGSIRVAHSGKQHHRITHRNSQTSRTEKSHSSDSVVWAPVRSHKRVEVIDDSSPRDAEAAVPLTKHVHVVQSGSKSKRAEMERYVPKQVAKELAQQGSIHQSTSHSTDLVDADGMDRKSMDRKSGTNSQTVETGGMSRIAAETRNVNSNKTRQMKVQGSWLQRGNTESATIQVSQDGSSSTTNVSKNSVMSIEPEPTLKPDEWSIKEQPSNRESPAVEEQPPDTEAENGVDGWVIYEEPINISQAKAPVFKDHGAIGRGRRNSHRGGYKGGFNNYKSGDDSHSSLVDTPQTERPFSPKENRVAVDRGMPNWQPKSQPHFRGNRSGGSESFNEDTVVSERETCNERNVKSPVQQELDHDVPAIQKKQREDSRGQRKSGHVKGNSHSSSQVDVRHVGPVPDGALDGHSHQRSGFRGHGNYNTHFNRVQESHGDWGSGMQDPKHQFVPGNRGRPRQNSHYEYQPVGPYSNDRSNSFEGDMDDVHGGPRFREKGPSQPRRGGGNFHGRPRGSARLDGSYE